MFVSHRDTTDQQTIPKGKTSFKLLGLYYMCVSLIRLPGAYVDIKIHDGDSEDFCHCIRCAQHNNINNVRTTQAVIQNQG